MTYQVVATGGVRRLSDGKLIVRGMAEWREYLLWARKNTPMPAPVFTPTLEARRQEMIRRIDKLRDRKIAEGVTLGQYRFDCHPTAIQVTTAMLVAFNAGTPLPANFKWRTKDGQTLTVTLSMLRQLNEAMVTRIYQCYVRSWALKDEVLANSTNPEAEDLEGGWPA